jgi:hypothetical protein
LQGHSDGDADDMLLSHGDATHQVAWRHLRMHVGVLLDAQARAGVRSRHGMRVTEFRACLCDVDAPGRCGRVPAAAGEGRRDAPTAAARDSRRCHCEGVQVLLTSAVPPLLWSIAVYF